MPFGDGQMVTQPIGGGERGVLVTWRDRRRLVPGYLLWVQLMTTLVAQPAFHRERLQ